MSYSFSWEEDWVDVSPISGTSTGEHDTITVTIDTTSLEIGAHTCSILITTTDGTGYFTVDVNVVEYEEPTLAYSPDFVDFGEMVEGNTDDAAITIWNNGLGTLSYSFVEDSDWLEVSPTSGTSHGEKDTVILSADTTGLELGQYSEEILIAPDAIDPNEITGFISEQEGNIKLFRNILGPSFYSDSKEIIIHHDKGSKEPGLVPIS